MIKSEEALGSVVPGVLKEWAGSQQARKLVHKLTGSQGLEGLTNPRVS